MKCIAHRGSSAPGRPENSKAAVKAAVDLGVDGIEVDLWFLHNRFWVFHDRRLSEAAFQRIDELSEHELLQHRLHNGEPLADLRDILDIVSGQCLLNLELKNGGGADLLAETLDDFNREMGVSKEHIIVSSFNHHALYDCRQKMPDIKLGVLLAALPLDYAACASPLNPYSFNSHVDLTTPALVNDIHQRGFQSWVYTANQADEWSELAAMGVDAVFTDRARQLQQFTAGASLH